MPGPRMVKTNGIELAVHEAGSGPPVVLLHGFPGLAFTWRHQIPALAAAGYRVIAPAPVAPRTATPHGRHGTDPRGRRDGLNPA